MTINVEGVAEDDISFIHFIQQNVYSDNKTTLVKEDDLSVFDAVKMKMGLVDTSQGKLVCSHCTSVLSHVHWPITIT